MKPDELVSAIFGGVALGLFAVLYLSSRFTYLIGESTLTMRWYILGRFQFVRRVLPLAMIKEARVPEPGRDYVKPKQVFGRYASRNAVVLVLREGDLGVRYILVTPDDPPTFIEAMNRAVARL